MPFNATPETINKMISFAETFLSNDNDFDAYLHAMIEKFFPDAHFDVINKMLSWAKYPTLPIISLNDLKELETGVRQKQFKESIATQIVSESTLVAHNTIIGCINSGNNFGHHGNCQDRNQKTITNGKLSTWAKCLNLILLSFSQPGFGPNNHGQYAYAENINSHASFVNLVHSLWSVCMEQIADKTQQKLLVLETKYNTTAIELAELKKDHEQLKEQYHELQYSTTLNTHSLKMLQPANPTYDYQAIKSRKKTLHIEFRRVSKLMKLL